MSLEWTSVQFSGLLGYQGSSYELGVDTCTDQWNTGLSGQLLLVRVDELEWTPAQISGLLGYQDSFYEFGVDICTVQWSTRLSGQLL